MNEVAPSDRPVVFFDGACGLCHRFVKRTVAADVADVFRFAPLDGETWRRMMPGRSPANTVVVRFPDGRTAVRSDAVVEVWSRLGDVERRRARMLAAVPRPLRNLGYRVVAAVRRFVAPRPTEACPRMPPDLRKRFLD